MKVLLSLMENDERISDVRWVAYILATVFWETRTPKTYQVPVSDKKGNQKRDKNGKLVTKRERRWTITMAPVNEVGRGGRRDYVLPVKVRQLPDGTTRVTEHDGDQFIVRNTGAVERTSKG